jgi:hypothetical protein
MLYAGRLQTGRYQFGQGDELSIKAIIIPTVALSQQTRRT